MKQTLAHCHAIPPSLPVTAVALRLRGGLAARPKLFQQTAKDFGVFF